MRISQGVQKFKRSTEDVRGKLIEWEVEEEVFLDHIVGSEDEEERVLAGGKSSVQMEEDRKALMARCRSAGVKVDPAWSSIRLKRELGEALDAPEPVDDMAALKARLAQLEEMTSMKARIAALEAELSGKAAPAPDETEALRAELMALGVKVDGRWSLTRLREELDQATAPGAKVA